MLEQILKNKITKLQIKNQLIKSVGRHTPDAIWRASETLSGVYKFELVRYIYIYIYGRTCAIIVAHAANTYCGRS